jgi:hypothetical protein
MTPINFDNIPQYLKDKIQWTVFECPDWVPGTQKPAKIPRLPTGDRMPAGYQITNNLMRFQDVQEACKKDPHYYPAYHIKPSDGFIFMDFDGTSDNIPVIPQYPSYCERSAYGYGYHIIAWYKGEKPKLPDTDEVYLTGRFVILTGSIVDDRKDINDLTEFLKKYTVKKDESIRITEPYKAPQYIGKLRNTTLHQLACSLANKGIGEPAVLAAVMQENITKCYEPLPDAEIRTLVKSACQFVKDNPSFKTAGSAPIIWTEQKGQIKNPLLPEPKETITPEEIEQKRSAYRKNVPDFPDLPDGFFKEYMEFGKRMSYAVPEYHFASILAVLSCAIGRKAVMISTSQKLYCIIYAMVIGQTTTSGKSTACNMAVDQFYGIIEQIGVCEKLTKKNSPQSVIQRLSKISNRLWHYDECSEFWSDIANKWAGALESILCSVYDGSEVSYGLSAAKGKVDEYKAKDVFLSLLWNTTDGEVERNANWNSFSNGFFPRFMWYWNFKINIPRINRAISDEDIAIRTGLERQIQHVRSILMRIPGNDMIQFEPSEIIEEWKIKNDLDHLNAEHEIYRAATGRLMGHAYKMAMMFSLMDSEVQKKITSTSIYPQKIRIPEEHARTALKIVEEYLRPRILYVAELCESNKTRSGQDSIKKILKKNDSVATKAKLLKNTHIRSKMMDELLSTMEESGEVTIKIEQTGTKPVMVVILNE